jgi:signal transduction histidine kinase
MDDPLTIGGVTWGFVTRVPWAALDVVAAGGLTAGALVVLGGLHYSAPAPLVATSAVACTTTVAWRRWSPAGAVLLVLVAVLIYQDLSHDKQGLVEPFAIVLCFYTLARREVRRGSWVRLAWLLGGALAVMTAIVADQPGFSGAAVLLAWVPMAVAPSAAGLLVERHTDLNALLAQTAAHLRTEQAARAAQATVLERNRVARELHDVVAHNVSVMVIQAGAARLLAPGDAAGAGEALALVVSSGRAALGDVRRVMGVLRRHDPVADSPRPGIAALDRLIEPVRATGVDADLDIDGQPFPLPAEVDLVAYRVVQEALTNAAKHASPGLATVRVRYRSGAVDLEITSKGNGPPGEASRVAGSGHGLIGMRERVEACGGQLRTGPRPGGDFRVWASLPVTTLPDSPAGPLPERLGRVRAWFSRFSDRAFAAASLVVLEADAVSYGHHHGWLWLNGPAVAVISVAALWRRRMPMLFLAAVAVACVAVRGLIPSDSATLTGTYVVLVPTYTIGAWAPSRRAVPGLALWVASAIAIAVIGHTLSAGLAAGGLMGGLAWCAGWLVRRERDLARQLQITTDRLWAEREQRAQLAVSEERARLARHLQSQVAQLVAAMVVQAQAAAEILAEAPGLAVDAISSVELTGRGALDQMRHILGVLRGGSLRREPAPQPGLSAGVSPIRQGAPT